MRVSARPIFCCHSKINVSTTDADDDIHTRAPQHLQNKCYLSRLETRSRKPKTPPSSRSSPESGNFDSFRNLRLRGSAWWSTGSCACDDDDGCSAKNPAGKTNTGKLCGIEPSACPSCDGGGGGGGGAHSTAAVLKERYSCKQSFVSSRARFTIGSNATVSCGGKS